MEGKKNVTRVVTIQSGEQTYIITDKPECDEKTPSLKERMLPNISKSLVVLGVGALLCALLIYLMIAAAGRIGGKKNNAYPKTTTTTTSAAELMPPTDFGIAD